MMTQYDLLAGIANVVMQEGMPLTVYGFSVCDENGFYTIFLNPNVSSNFQEESFYHELAHILNGDFDRMAEILRKGGKLNASLLEAIRHEED